MASVFGKIFVGIYVEIKRSDGTFLASSQTQRDTHARQTHARTQAHRLSIRRLRMREANDQLAVS